MCYGRSEEHGTKNEIGMDWPEVTNGSTAAEIFRHIAKRKQHSIKIIAPAQSNHGAYQDQGF
jgi:hypothetical protein